MRNIPTICCSLLITCLLCCCDNLKGSQEAFGQKENKKNKKSKNEAPEVPSRAVDVAHKWELPKILQEISGLAYLDKDRFACVQDESGVIFIYNTASGKIEQQVTFGGSGDYEGLALVSQTAYVVRSDGTIFEISPLGPSTPEVRTYTTSLTAAHNVEGITADPRHQRLLLAIKDKEAGAKTYKGIYAFNLKSKELAADPVFRLELTDSLLQGSGAKQLQQAFQPSEIAVHPTTGDIYLTEATNPQLLILNPEGRIQSRHKLNEEHFPQPEGMAFSPTGELYISNEGKKGKGTILQVNIR